MHDKRQDDTPRQAPETRFDADIDQRSWSSGVESELESDCTARQRENAFGERTQHHRPQHAKEGATCGASATTGGPARHERTYLDEVCGDLLGLQLVHGQLIALDQGPYTRDCNPVRSPPARSRTHARARTLPEACICTGGCPTPDDLTLLKGGGLCDMHGRAADGACAGCTRLRRGQWMAAANVQARGLLLRVPAAKLWLE